MLNRILSLTKTQGNNTLRNGGLKKNAISLTKSKMNWKENTISKQNLNCSNHSSNLDLISRIQLWNPSRFSRGVSGPPPEVPLGENYEIKRANGMPLFQDLDPNDDISCAPDEDPNAFILPSEAFNQLLTATVLLLFVLVGASTMYTWREPERVPRTFPFGDLEKDFGGKDSARILDRRMIKD
eukprot:TRINITY_DN17_c0_g1_i1.p1 TRINITY_DN17_c0_g1~~TRINITY_DN17_c0_g1_i1.p1  ORF type:complete len:183 (+),score=56.95 TRINITY_DN17_c0_g1_i1:197-745(+)